MRARPAARAGSTTTVSWAVISRRPAKTPWTTLSSPSTIGTGAPGTMTVGDTTGWRVGDTITIDTEAVTIATLPGSNQLTINETLGQVHWVSTPTVVTLPPSAPANCAEERRTAECSTALSTMCG